MDVPSVRQRTFVSVCVCLENVVSVGRAYASEYVFVICVFVSVV